jgi:hypothetical protein
MVSGLRGHLVAEAANDPTLARRTWVLRTEAAAAVRPG